MATYEMVEQGLTAEPIQARTGMGLAGALMLWNTGLCAAGFVVGLVMCNTAPSIASDPACNTGAYHACIFGDPQAVWGFLLCAAMVLAFIGISMLIGIIGAITAVANRHQARR